MLIDWSQLWTQRAEPVPYLHVINIEHTIIYAGVVSRGVLKGRLGAAKSALQNRLEKKPATFSGLHYEMICMTLNMFNYSATP